MSIIISALHFPWETIDDCCRIAREELGLDGVELSLHPSFQRPHCTREDLAALPAAAARYGLSLDAHIWENLAELGEDAGAAALEGWLPACRQAGIGGLIIHGGSHPDQRAGIALTGAIFRRVLGAYERAGVVLKLENHYAYDYHRSQELFSAPWEFEALFAEVSSPSLRCCFDTGHGHMNGNGEALLRAMAPYLAHVHLADNHGVDDDHCAYREGTVPWDAYFELLTALRFAGAWCVEFPVREDRSPFRQCVADIRARASL